MRVIKLVFFVILLVLEENVKLLREAYDLKSKKYIQEEKKKNTTKRKKIYLKIFGMLLGDWIDVSLSFYEKFKKVFRVFYNIFIF